MRHLLVEIYEKVLDYIFPKEEIVQELEKGLLGDNISILPSSDFNDIEFINPLLDYSDRKVRALIWAIKYRRNKKLSDFSGKILFESILAEIGEKILFNKTENNILIPIPISSERRNERGFNQAEILCQSILKNDSDSFFEYEPDVLFKNRSTPPQTRLKRNERIKNLEGCFSIRNPEKIKDKTIILIDDVTTTGSTIREARKILKEGGAKKVTAFVLAH